MTDIEYWDGELTSKIVELEQSIGSLKSLFGGDKEACAAKCDSLLKRVREVKKGYNYEMRMSLKNDPRRHEYAEKLKTADERIAALETELKWAKSEADKKVLFKGAGGKGGVDGGGGMGGERTNDSHLKEAKKLQDKTEASLQSALEMVEATKKVGADTVDELKRQTDQIAEITDTVDAMEDGLTRADKLIRAFGRRIATDKFIQLFFVLNFGLLIGIVVWYAIKKGKIKTPKINTPPLPTFDEIFGSGGGGSSSSSGGGETITPAAAPNTPPAEKGGGEVPPEIVVRFLRGVVDVAARLRH